MGMQITSDTTTTPVPGPVLLQTRMAHQDAELDQEHFVDGEKSSSFDVHRERPIAAKSTSYDWITTISADLSESVLTTWISQLGIMDAHWFAVSRLSKIS